MALPENLKLIGFNTNVKHTVGGGRYTSARIGAFMGLGIIQDHLGKAGSDCAFGGYLCAIDPAEFDVAYRPLSWHHEIPYSVRVF